MHIAVSSLLSAPSRRRGRQRPPSAFLRAGHAVCGSGQGCDGNRDAPSMDQEQEHNFNRICWLRAAVEQHEPNRQPIQTAAAGESTARYDSSAQVFWLHAGQACRPQSSSLEAESAIASPSPPPPPPPLTTRPWFKDAASALGINQHKILSDLHVCMHRVVFIHIRQSIRDWVGKKMQCG